MSRIGRQPITVPTGVEVTISGATITVKGSKGVLERQILPGIKVTQQDNSLIVARENEEKTTRGFHGLMRTLISNMVTGVSEGFSKQLEINGVGFKANVSGKLLTLSLGFSHDIKFTVPDDIELESKDNTLTIKGIDKQRVGQVAAEIRAYRKPEPYKGKGIKYSDEHIVRKAGKTATAG